jgi:hypothetical protein
LERREKAWEILDFRKPVQVCVPFDSTGIYDFTGGAFLLGTRLYSASRRPTIGYSYVSLPSFSEEEDEKEVQWMGLNLRIQILDVGLAVQEHDLIAALTAGRWWPIREAHDIGNSTIEVFDRPTPSSC